MCEVKGLSKSKASSLLSLTPYLLAGCLLASQLMAEAPHAEEGASAAKRPGQSQTTSRRAPCAADPKRLADFANGDKYDYSTLVTFLSSSACDANQVAVSQKAMAYGVSFGEKAPYRFDLYAAATVNNDLKGRDKADLTLQKRIPNLLRQYPLGSQELLPVIGQLSLLSPSASRLALVNLSQQQLYTADSLIDAQGSDKVGKRVATALLRLGANRGPIAKSFADSVEEMAVLAQADSLRKIFRSLGAAAVANNALVGTFNLSAEALTKGIRRSESLYSEADRQAMLEAVYGATATANEGNELFHPAMAQLNNSLAPLIEGEDLKRTALKKAWHAILVMLGENASQPVLAEAVADSLTPEILFLSEGDRVELLLAARNYHPLAVSIQRNYISGYHRLWSNLKKKRLSRDRFLQLRGKFLKPWVSQILDLGPARVTRVWLQEVIRVGLVSDEDVEKKFPLFVLANIQRRDRASLQAAQSQEAAPKMASLAENLAVMWSLSRIHVPLLLDWVEQYGDAE